jgi:hypothetical protein
VESHLALIEEEFVRRGMDPVEARLAARRAYGGIEQAKELHRDERSIVWLEQTFSDIRYACRNLLRNPGFVLVVVLTLTLGIGANATLFSAYNAVALKPLPVADPNEVVRFERWFEHGYRGENQYGFSYPEYAYCRDHNDVFSSLVAASWPNQVLIQALNAHTMEPEMAAAQFVSGQLLCRSRDQFPARPHIPAGGRPCSWGGRRRSHQSLILGAPLPFRSAHHR